MPRFVGVVCATYYLSAFNRRLESPVNADEAVPSSRTTRLFVY